MFLADPTIQILGNSENACLERGCHGACCFNNDIQMSTDEFEQYNPNNFLYRVVKTKEDYYNILHSRDPRIHPDGTYVWVDEEGICHVANVGRHCWNYKWGKGCGIWGQHPYACQDFKLDGESCQTARRIEPSLVEEQ